MEAQLHGTVLYMDIITYVVQYRRKFISSLLVLSLIARFMGPKWGPSGADRTQVAPCWPHELCYMGYYYDVTGAACYWFIETSTQNKGIIVLKIICYSLTNLLMISSYWPGDAYMGKKLTYYCLENGLSLIRYTVTNSTHILRVTSLGLGE